MYRRESLTVTPRRSVVVVTRTVVVGASVVVVVTSTAVVGGAVVVEAALVVVDTGSVVEATADVVVDVAVSSSSSSSIRLSRASISEELVPPHADPMNNTQSTAATERIF